MVIKMLWEESAWTILLPTHPISLTGGLLGCCGRSLQAIKMLREESPWTYTVAYSPYEPDGWAIRMLWEESAWTTHKKHTD